MGLLRLFLALAVVIAHSEPIFGWGFTRLTGGRLAVQMFYVISGFYMALVLHRRYTGPGHYRRFLSNRFLRLYPSYAVVAIFTLVVCGGASWLRGSAIRPLDYWATWGGALAPESWLALGAANLLLLGQDAIMFAAVDPHSGGLYLTPDFIRQAVPAYRFLLVPQAWTLGVELLFYLIAPFIVTRRASQIGALLVLGLVLRWFVRDALGLSRDPWDYRFFPIELPLFLWGSLAFKAYAALEARGWLPRELGGAALAFILSAVVLHAGMPYAWQSGVLGLPMLAIALGPALPFLFHVTRDSRRDRWIGELSYPVYIAHWVVAILLRSAGVSTSIIGLAACALSLTLAVVLRRWIEEPVEHWRHPGESESRANATPARAVLPDGAALLPQRH